MFDGTIEILTERAVDLPIQRETRTAALLVQYEQGLETGQPDTMLLQQAHQSLQEALLGREVDRELAHLAVALSYHLSNWHEAAQWIAPRVTFSWLNSSCFAWEESKIGEVFLSCCE